MRFDLVIFDCDGVLVDSEIVSCREHARFLTELGYPIMVTPLSQFVGSQAAINVIVGERYKEVTDQVIPGYWESISMFTAYAVDAWIGKSNGRTDPPVT